jgi:hypothetical protein
LEPDPSSGGLRIRDDLKSVSFGFGRRSVNPYAIICIKLRRRVCPGQQLAHKSLFITTVYILWAFRISQVEQEPINTYGFTDTANLHPLPFKARFTPRFGKSELVEILRSAEEVM